MRVSMSLLKGESRHFLGATDHLLTRLRRWTARVRRKHNIHLRFADDFNEMILNFLQE
jgi:hypothetical protein